MNKNNLASILLLLATTFLIQACSDASQNGNLSEPKLVMETTQVQEGVTFFNGDSLVFDETFYNDTSREFPPVLPEFIHSIQNNTLSIEGYYLSNSGGFNPNAVLNVDRNDLNITITIPEEGTVIPETAGWFYNLSLSNIPAGDYNLNITHRADAFRQEGSGIAFSKSFTIE